MALVFNLTFKNYEKVRSFKFILSGFPDHIHDSPGCFISLFLTPGVTWPKTKRPACG